MAYKIRNLIYEEDSYTPEILGSISNPTVTYTRQDGYYVRVGDYVWVSVYIIINTISGGSGGLDITLPITPVTGSEAIGNITTVFVPFNPSAAYQATITYPGITAIKIFNVIDDAAFSGKAVTTLSNGEILRLSIGYSV